MSKKTTKSTIKCRAACRHLLNGTETDDLAFECDGIVAHPLSEARAEEALAEHFKEHQYINARTLATLYKCSRPTAYRRIDELVAKGKLRKSTIAKGVYEWVG